MRLWTWQGSDFNAPFERVDRKKSGFLIHEACPNIRQAYAELDERLSLPASRKGQFIWCYTTKSWGDPWGQRRLWSLDVPENAVIAFVDNPVWEHLIGSTSIPASLRRKWEQEIRLRRLVGDQYYQEVERKEQEYHVSFPSRQACLQRLLSPTCPGEDVSALVLVPLDPSWILAE